MKAVTERQLEVLRLIHTHLSVYGWPPTQAEMCGALGVTVNAIKCHLEALDRKGFVKRGAKLKARELVLLPAALIALGKAPHVTGYVEEPRRCFACGFETYAHRKAPCAGCALRARLSEVA